MPGMRIGGGIDTGRAFVGTTGSPHRLDYTAHGDSVNAAARIEAANKGLGTEILISASTYQALDTLERETLGCSLRAERVTVKGKALELHRVIIPASASASLP